MRTQLTFGSLFSGIGGMDLGLTRAGMVCKWQVEIDPFCRKVLTKHWPEVPKYGDIREIDGSELERVDLIAGGFPCQPVSLAGKRLGEGDERWMWPEFIRIIRAVRPARVLLENTPGLLVLGFGTILGDLAASGYDAEWDCIPAASVGAAHLRDRVFVVAHTLCSRPPQPQQTATRGWSGRGGTPLIVAIAQKLWPTLSSRDWKGTSAASWREGNPSPDTLPDAVAAALGLDHRKTVHLSPGFCEEFMGFPIGWTELEHSETP